jgi:hypothetical protein
MESGAGYPAAVTTDFEDITGRKPSRFRQARQTTTIEENE